MLDMLVSLANACTLSDYGENETLLTFHLFNPGRQPGSPLLSEGLLYAYQASTSQCYTRQAKKCFAMQAAPFA